MQMHGNGNGHSYGQTYLSDIWVYNSTSLQWFWVRGEETPASTGNYNLKNVSSSLSLPPGRDSAIPTYAASTGTIVLFGGSKFSLNLNDVWYIDIGNMFRTQISSVTSSSFLPASTSTSTMSTVNSNSLSTLASSRTINIAATPSAPTAVKGQIVTDALMKYLYYIITLAGVILLITGGLCLWQCRRSKRIKREKSFDESGWTMSTTMSTSSSMGTTMMNDETEFAVPGFLQLKAGAEFRWRNSIAKGGGGEVFIGDALIPRLQEFGPTIIVKIIGPNRGSVQPRISRAFDQEISVMHYLGRHKNIAGLLGWCEEPVSMLMKYYAIGALDKFIDNGSVVSKVLKICFMLDISRGLEFMHSKQVAHCDMKPANILVDQDRNGMLFCALTDFGISQVYSLNAKLVHAFAVVNLRGASITYAAPEVVVRLRTHNECTQELAFAGDVYSAGMIAFALLNTSDGWI